MKTLLEEKKIGRQSKGYHKVHLLLLILLRLSKSYIQRIGSDWLSDLGSESSSKTIEDCQRRVEALR